LDSCSGFELGAWSALESAVKFRRMTTMTMLELYACPHACGALQDNQTKAAFDT
jgi:hypothetical protein